MCACGCVHVCVCRQSLGLRPERTGSVGVSATNPGSAEDLQVVNPGKMMLHFKFKGRLETESTIVVKCLLCSRKLSQNSTKRQSGQSPIFETNKTFLNKTSGKKKKSKKKIRQNFELN